MNNLIVYESAWGNTRAIAEAIATGLPRESPAEVLPVSEAPPLQDLLVDLLVVGAPTHAFGLSRPGTREDAHRRGGQALSGGLREWIDATDGSHLTVASFDTHVRRPNLPGAASRSAAKKLRRLGCTVLDRQSFWVDGYEGPLLDGEVDRARAWGMGLVQRRQRGA